MIYYKYLKWVIVLSVSVSLFGCASDKDEQVIAKVNEEPIYLKDFKRELTFMAKQNPSLEVDKETVYDLMDTLIKRQLIIQEAMKRDMAEDPGFVDTIKSFWEQTLIRNFIEYKIKEFDMYVFVTDAEVETYYDKLQDGDMAIPPLGEAYNQIKDMIEQEKKSRALDDWLEKERKGSRIQIEKEILTRQVQK